VRTDGTVADEVTEVEDEFEEVKKQPLHKDVLLYLQEQRYRQGCRCTKNEKRCVRRKAIEIHIGIKMELFYIYQKRQDQGIATD